MKIKQGSKIIKSAAEIVFRTVSLYLTSRKMPEADIAGYHLTHNGKYIVFDTGADSPAGEIRCVSRSVRDNKMFISFYSKSAFDKNMYAEYIFPVKLPEQCDEIYVYRENGYSLDLYKDKISGIWLRSSENI